MLQLLGDYLIKIIGKAKPRSSKKKWKLTEKHFTIISHSINLQARLNKSKSNPKALLPFMISRHFSMVCGQDFFPYSVLFSPFFSKKISGHCFFTQLLIHEQATSYINTPMLSLTLYHISLSLASLLSDKEKQEWELLITSPTFALSPAQEANENQCRYSLNLASYQPFSLLFVSVYIVCKREGSLSLFSLSLSLSLYIYIYIYLLLC
jgi:hypothetical protein